MDKRKAGLHRKVSSIFDGVPVQNPDDSSGPVPSQPDQPIDDKVAGPTGHEDSGIRSAFGPRPAPGAGGMSLADKLVGREAQRPAPRNAMATGLAAKREYKLSGNIPGVSDPKKKMRLAMLSVLCVVLVVVLYSTFNPKSRLSQTLTDLINPEQEQSRNIILPESEIEWVIPPLYPEEIRDPMDVKTANEFVVSQDQNQDQDQTQPEVEVEVDGEENVLAVEDFVVGKDIEIRSIYYSEKGGAIVVGEEILYQGEVVAGATILKINADTVDFERQGHKFSKSVSP